MRNKQSFITGAIVLGTAGVIARFLGLFFRWPVTMLIGDEGIGIYGLVYPVYMFIIGIMSGFPIAISRMVSERTALGKRVQAHRVFQYSMLTLFLLGTASSILIYLSCPYIIKVLKWRSEVYYSFAAIAFAPVFVSIMDSFRGYYQGLQMMTLPAVSQVVEQLGRVVVGVGLTYALLPYGVAYSAAGASFGACAGAVLGCILLLLAYLKNRRYIIPRGTGEVTGGGIGVVKELLTTAIPISLGMTVGSIMSLIDSIVVPARLSAAGFSLKTATELYGQLTGKAHVLINVPLTFSVALGTTLVPAMSEVKAFRNFNKIKDRTQSAVKVSMIIGLPSSIGLLIMADPILHLIFPGRSEGAAVLQVLSISVVFIVLAQVLVSILQGVGDVMSPVKNILIGSGVKLVLSYVLTGMPLLNVKGAAVASIAGYMVAALLNFRDVKRYTYFSFDIDKMFLRPLFAAMVMGMSVCFMYNIMLGISGRVGISTIVSVIIGIIIYILMLLILGCITFSEAASYIKHGKQKK
jgi:Uncharacterized membrane protein, putative virulence factor